MDRYSTEAVTGGAVKDGALLKQYLLIVFEWVGKHATVHVWLLL